MMINSCRSRHAVCVCEHEKSGKTKHWKTENCKWKWFSILISFVADKKLLIVIESYFTLDVTFISHRLTFDFIFLFYCIFPSTNTRFDHLDSNRHEFAVLLSIVWDLLLNIQKHTFFIHRLSAWEERFIYWLFGKGCFLFVKIKITFSNKKENISSVDVKKFYRRKI